MSSALVLPERSAHWFAGTALAILILSALLAGLLPLGFSLGTVFLLAGPHNWVEVRYFLTRFPARPGKLLVFFLAALVGVVGLTVAFAGLTWLALVQHWEPQEWSARFAWWNVALVLWVAVLLLLRSRQRPRRNWTLPLLVTCALLPTTWLAPEWWGLALVYIHPLLALWILDREIIRRHPGWRGVYRRCLALLPLLLLFLWWTLRNAPPLPGEGQDALTIRLTHHAGAHLLPSLPAHLLVATHAFLEMVHYAVWLVAIPLLAQRHRPWDLANVPLARRSLEGRFVVTSVLLAGLGLVLLLWLGFLFNYPATRDCYFTLAMFHVLAEVPFLVRLL